MAKKRYYSLDVFRGAAVALMILVNNPGSWSYMFAPMKHAPWHGVTPTDLVFPFFLFAVGNAMVFVIPRLRESGDSVFWSKITKRTILIFAIGLFLNWFPFVQWSGDSLVFKHWVNPENPEQGIRILGVLQRIALAYFFASILVFYLREKTLIWVSAGVLFVYWAMTAWAGGSDPYSLEGWFGTQIDLNILGVAHMYKGEGIPFDPEGIISTLPAIIQVVFGYLTGLLIREKGNVSWLWPKFPKTENGDFKITSVLMVIGFVFLVLGWIWSLGFPLNKKIWTSSYVLYTTGLAVLTLGTLVWYLEVGKVKNAVTQFFDVFGKNPLFIFVLSGLLPRLMGLIRIPKGMSSEGQMLYTSPLRWYYESVCAKIPGPPEWGSFAYAFTFLVFMWVICYYLDKKRIYIKV